jgi:hypothetical protein
MTSTRFGPTCHATISPDRTLAALSGPVLTAAFN